MGAFDSLWPVFEKDLRRWDAWQWREQTRVAAQEKLAEQAAKGGQWVWSAAERQTYIYKTVRSQAGLQRVLGLNLIEVASSGDVKAAVEIVMSFMEALDEVIVTIGGRYFDEYHSGEIFNLLAEAVTDCMTGRKGSRPKVGALSSFLESICKNKTIDVLRREKRQQTTSDGVRGVEVSIDSLTSWHGEIGAKWAEIDREPALGFLPEELGTVERVAEKFDSVEDLMSDLAPVAAEFSRWGESIDRDLQCKLLRALCKGSRLTKAILAVRAEHPGWKEVEVSEYLCNQYLQEKPRRVASRLQHIRDRLLGVVEEHLRGVELEGKPDEASRAVRRLAKRLRDARGSEQRRPKKKKGEGERG
ncbi:MAG: hypothetical protein M0000_02170 [Actinomycetota bacterium]|nr:hypothetical protein [Actinomycetota bacterium]